MEPDAELDAVVTEVRRLDPLGERTAVVLRDTLDQLYDGQHTGRYRIEQLHKTEKTHCGTLVEINLHREFEFADGETMDYKIAGIEVDCKYSQFRNGWMIPLEAVGHLCLLLWADDHESKWILGIVRIQNEILTHGGNRDAKRSISAEGRTHIKWIFENAELPPNILLHLPPDQLDEIMGLNSGQKRINQIFRVAQMKRIGRGVIATLGQQDDYMKRLRDNGGSRGMLRPEGIIILGEYAEHQRVARSLGVPVPAEGESVSVRVAPATEQGPGVVQIGEGLWRVATASDPVTEAPRVPHH